MDTFPTKIPYEIERAWLKQGVSKTLVLDLEAYWSNSNQFALLAPEVARCQVMKTYMRKYIAISHLKENYRPMTLCDPKPLFIFDSYHWGTCTNLKKLGSIGMHFVGAPKIGY